MKKLLMTFSLLAIIVLLTGCKDNEDVLTCESGEYLTEDGICEIFDFSQYDYGDEYGITPFVNDEIDNKADVLTEVTSYLTTVESLITEASYGDLFSESIPIYRSDLSFYDDFSTPAVENYSLQLSILEGYLSIIEAYLEYNDTFTENQVFNIYDGSAKGTISINEGEMEFWFYQNQYSTRVVGYYAYITFYEGELLFFSKFLSYDLETEVYGFYRETLYHHNNHQLNRNIFVSADDQDTYIGLFEYYRNPTEQLYEHKKIDNSTNEHVTYYRYYDPSKELSYEVKYIDDNEEYVKLKKYFGDNELFYSFRTPTELLFDYNLMEISGWDQINAEDYRLVVLNNDQSIELPDSHRIEINSYYGTLVVKFGEDTSDINESDFNLTGTGLTTEFTYQNILDYEDYAREQASLKFVDFDHDLENLSDVFNSIYNFLDKDIFIELALYEEAS